VDVHAGYYDRTAVGILPLTTCRVLSRINGADDSIGTVLYGEGDKFDPAKLKAYPAGSFIVENRICRIT